MSTPRKDKIRFLQALQAGNPEAQRLLATKQREHTIEHKKREIIGKLTDAEADAGVSIIRRLRLKGKDILTITDDDLTPQEHEILEQIHQALKTR